MKQLLFILLGAAGLQLISCASKRSAVTKPEVVTVDPSAPKFKVPAVDTTNTRTRKAERKLEDK